MPTPPSRLLPLLAATILAAAAAAHAGDEPTRPDAAPYLGLPATSSISSPESWTTVRSFPNLEFDDPVFMLPEPGSNRIFVNEREGRIVSFEDDPATDEMTVVLDLREHTQGDSDSGMLSMAFHPDYAVPGAPSEGHIYVAYSYRLTSSEDPDENLPLYFRVSRFIIPPGTGTVDPDSELVLIEQLDQHLWHQGGAIFFHPVDGFLYITIGDEGGGRCAYNNCQRIDRDLFAGVLRIDVDRIGGIVSHPIPKQPLTGHTANYYIPNDNPFVGMPNVLEEFYAIGLRSPHRMTHDAIDDVTFIGEVGQNFREEIDVLTPGANFQWNWMEGTIPFEDHTGTPSPLIGTWTAPIRDYGRELGGTIIGGYVYRGSRYADLYGKYIYGDFLSGRIWALRYGKNGDAVTVLENTQLMQTVYRGREDGITSFGVDHAGEIHVLTLGAPGHIYRIVAAPRNPGTMPLTLSATGLFTDLDPLTPRAELIPYSVRNPLWSDGAHKRRWMSIPTPSTIGYSPTAAWTVPAGSVFVKHFEFPTSELDPEQITPLETRVLVMQANGQLYGVTYKWREDGSDADIVTEAVEDDITVTAGGGVRLQPYWYPGPNDCLTCHNNGAGQILGIKARQLAGVEADPALGTDLDQLRWLSEADVLNTDLDDDDIAAIAPLRGLDEETASVESRVRSYLDSNCAHCHGSTAIDRALWDGRFTTPLNDQGIIMGELLGDYASSDDRVVRPGHPAQSIMHRRTFSTDRADRMPPVGRSQRDEAFVSLLEEWVESMEYVPLQCPDVLADPDRCLAAPDYKARLRIDSRFGGNEVRWDIARGPDLGADELLDPEIDPTVEYALCIYDADMLTAELKMSDACLQSPCWVQQSSGRLLYRGTPIGEGVRDARFKPGAAGRSHISLGAGGITPSLLPLTTPIAVQLLIAREGVENACIHTDLTTIKRYTSTQARLASP